MVGKVMFPYIQGGTVSPTEQHCCIGGGGRALSCLSKKEVKLLNMENTGTSDLIRILLIGSEIEKMMLVATHNFGKRGAYSFMQLY